MNSKKIMELQRQIAAEEQKIRGCSHQWGEVYSDPRIEKQPYGVKYEGKGVDVWPEPKGYRDVTTPRWARECIKCGLIEHTEEQEPVIAKYRPKFG